MKNNLLKLFIQLNFYYLSFEKWRQWSELKKKKKKEKEATVLLYTYKRIIAFAIF